MGLLALIKDYVIHILCFACLPACNVALFYFFLRANNEEIPNCVVAPVMQTKS